MVRIGEFCGSSATLKCQLPNGDLETLVSITSDEDLANLIEEYDRASSSKIRAVLFPRKSVKTVSPPPSVAQSVVDFSPPSKPPPFPAPKLVPTYFVSRGPSPLGFTGKVRLYPCSLQGNLHQYQHHHHHYQHYHQVPPSYYWRWLLLRKPEEPERKKVSDAGNWKKKKKENIGGKGNREKTTRRKLKNKTRKRKYIYRAILWLDCEYWRFSFGTIL